MDETGIKKFIEFVKSSKNIIICGHENPDPDAICSCIAMEYLLSKFEKGVICLNSDATPTNLLILDYRKILNSLETGGQLPNNLEKYSLLVLDTNNFQNTGKIFTLVEKKIKKMFIIDHHALNNVEIDNSFIDDNASSICEIIFQLYEYLKIDMPKEIGDAIYTGILFDTGSFHYPKTSQYTFHAAYEIIKNGTNPNQIYLLIYEQESIEYLKAISFVLSTLELFYNNQIAVIKMPKEFLLKSGAKYDECASIINIPLASKRIRAVIFCKENLEGIKRVSMRSKGDVDVVKIAINYNGGGHKNAAGFKIDKSKYDFNQIIPDIISHIEKEIIKEQNP